MGYVGDPLRQTVTAWGFVITTFDKMRLKLSLGNKRIFETGDVALASFWILANYHIKLFSLLTYLDRIAGSDTHDNSAAL